MADLNRMDRTWLCSVLFMDIVQYSSQSVEVQMKWKKRFNGYLMEAIQAVPENERIILDTGDGAAVCFLGAPEAAMFAALQLCRSFILDEQKQRQGLRVRLGINLGPVKLIKDINGSINAIGDGINAGQRIMSFAAENQILVSQSFFEVASRLSDDYKLLFKLKGVEKDKHVREHTVYHLVPPGAEKQDSMIMPAFQGLSLAEQPSREPSPPPERAIPAAASPRDPGGDRAPNPPASQRSSTPWLVGGAALLVLAGAGTWYFLRPTAPAAPNVNPAPAAASQATAPNPPAAATVTEPTPPAAPVSLPTKSTAAVRPKDAPAPKAEPGSRGDPAKAIGVPLATAAKENSPPLPSPPRPGPVAANVTADAKTAYDEGSALLEQDKLAEALARFNDAIRASPDYIDAYVGRAAARRNMGQYELSIEDCNKIIQLRPDEPRGHNCRGFGYMHLNQYQRAVGDFDEAIRLNPNFAIAYENRGNAYSNLQQYERAIQDYSEVIRLRPRDGPAYARRATAYRTLKEYKKAAQDYTEAIRLQPNNTNAYRGRAAAEEALGDAAGAAADRTHARESRKKE